jgi:hypothetical protein
VRRWSLSQSQSHSPKLSPLKYVSPARPQWLTPISLAISEAGIGRIIAPGQPGQNSLRNPISMEKKLGRVVHACHPSNGRKQDPISIITRAKRAGGVAQAVEHLNSNPSTAAKHVHTYIHTYTSGPASYHLISCR